MMKMFVAIAIATAAWAGVANAAEFRLGNGYFQSTGSNNDLPQPYFDTYPGVFCGTKAIRVQVLGSTNGFNNREFFKMRRVYWAYQTPAPHGPFAAYTKTNIELRHGDTSPWIDVPNVNGSCLKKVRVYIEGNDTNPPAQGETVFAVVYGKK